MKTSVIFAVIFVVFVGFVAARLEFDIYKRKPNNEIGKEKLINDSIVLYKFLNGELPMQKFRGEYYGYIGVGSPLKSFKVMFDTTWADTWLPSSHCALTEIVCQLHTKYDSSASSSYIPNGQFINVTSKDLSLMGILSTDTFHLPHLKLENHTFLEATHISLDPFWQYRSDGIIGLAFKESSNWPDGTSPFMYNLLQQDLIKEMLFTFYMNRDETTAKAGKIIFGGRQRTHVKNETLTTLKVIEKKLWTVQIDSISAESNKTMRPICEKCTAFFDSSSNTITGPFEQIQKLNYMMNGRWIPGIKKYSVNCRQYAKLPLVHFILNGNDFVLQSKYYVQRVTIDSIEACFSPFVPNPDTTSKMWMLGGAFMMEFYSEFDMDNGVINIGETVF